MKPFFKLISFFIIVCSVLATEAQKKSTHSSQKHKSPKAIKFITPTPIPPDDLKNTFSEQSHVFVWELKKDTALPAAVLYIEVVEILPDTLIFTRFYTNKPMNYRVKDRYKYNKDESNEMYSVKTEKAHYTIYYETLSVWNAATKKYDKYEVSRDGYIMGLGKLVNLKTKRVYKRDELYDVVGTSIE